MSIVDFLRDRPNISLRGLETEADLPTKTLSHLTIHFAISRF